MSRIELDVPRKKQPDEFTCLPTCVSSVLEYLGHSTGFDEVVEACRLGPRGAQLEVALQGLQEAEWDVEILATFDGEIVRSALAEDQPVVLVLYRGREGEDGLSHAVVVRGMDEHSISIMDPLRGDYEELPLPDAASRLADEFRGGFLIRGDQAQS